jgi:hypothetical protein
LGNTGNAHGAGMAAFFTKSQTPRRFTASLKEHIARLKDNPYINLRKSPQIYAD